MAKGRTQLNINIEPELLLKLKKQAIQEGKTLTQYVTEKLDNNHKLDNDALLEERLIKIEESLGLKKSAATLKQNIGVIFTDHGAKKYGEVAKEEFEYHCKEKGLTIEKALQELSLVLKKLPHASPELVFTILLGTHSLTAQEMTQAYRHGSCAMRTALVLWSNDPLEKLNHAFLNAVITKSLK
ncbi:hypothetical protein [Prochlorococcus sp. MIT 1307]|uniref:hypothetical protein n=1 Tax=Prochlorococcus sp. MIT 1307 TaxID=3096219 RepID=UPI002A761B7F|nr:hypothetical protein [Prochlorococcus sp. MIT 1307]